jgi:hypothetical protein
MADKREWLMKLRFSGDRVTVLDAASPTSVTITDNASVAEVLERNRRLWIQGVAPAIANNAEHDLLRAMNRRNRDFWGAR